MKSQTLLILFGMLMCLELPTAFTSSPVSSSSPPSSSSPVSSFSFKERFNKLVQRENNHHRERRQLFKLPHHTSVEVKWAVNFVFTTEKVYKSTLQMAIPTGIELDDFWLKDEATPPFEDLFPVKGGRRKRSANNMDRIVFYRNMEELLKRQGYAGRPCLLRTICETAEAPLHFGVMGDFFNLALTPSVGSVTSEDEELSEHLRAEAVGRKGVGCYLEYGDACGSSLFDILPLVKKLSF